MLASLLCSILVYTKYFPFRADAAVGANITATAELLLKGKQAWKARSPYTQCPCIFQSERRKASSTSWH